MILLQNMDNRDGHTITIRGTAIHLVGEVEAGHVIGIIAEEVHQGCAGSRYHLWHSANGEVAAIHEATKRREAKPNVSHEYLL